MLKIKRNFGYFIFCFLSVFVPFILWIIGKRSMDFLTIFGQTTGLIGLAMFSLNFVLASRLKFLEDLFHGMDRVYFAHRLFGTISFILLLLHPLLLMISLIPFSLNSAALFILPSGNWPINFGIISLFIMLSVLVFLFYSNFSYQFLKYTHKILGISFFFGSLHAFLVPSALSQNLYLKLYMIALVSLGITFFVYRSLLSRFLSERAEYIVENINLLSNDVLEISMTPKNKAICFMPGQFIFISFRDSKIGLESHPFSISSSCFDEKLALVIKSLGDFTSRLKDLKVGTVAEIEGPFGKFLPNFDKNQIWIAGGVGITPFLSMAKSINGENSPIDLYCVVKNKNENICLDKLYEISDKKKNLRVLPFYTEKQGRISAKAIEKLSGGLNDKHIYLCGPPPMMQSLRSQLLKLQVLSRDIHFEEFSFL